MNKKYIKPIINIARFSKENIVTTSGGSFTKGLYNTSAGAGNWSSGWSSTEDTPSAASVMAFE